jgi:hypothetical protein
MHMYVYQMVLNIVMAKLVECAAFLIHDRLLSAEAPQADHQGGGCEHREIVT